MKGIKQGEWIVEAPTMEKPDAFPTLEERFRNNGEWAKYKEHVSARPRYPHYGRFGHVKDGDEVYFRIRYELVKSSDNLSDWVHVDKFSYEKCPYDKFKRMIAVPIRPSNRVDLFSRAEKAIHDAMNEVEKIGADVRLTDAVIKLEEAQKLVYEYYINL